MNSTMALFDERVQEIDFFYSIMLDIDQGSNAIRTQDNAKFQRMLKSNFLLMLYNLVEACTISGLLEIYEHMNSESSAYYDLIDEIQKLWTNNRIGEIYKNQAGIASYENRVQEIIHQITTSQPIELKRQVFKEKGNFDARAIMRLCDKHRIRYIASDDDGHLRTVKDKRNHLAHGDESFGDCARDMTLSDLEKIKNAVVTFISCILTGMKDYDDNKAYLAANQVAATPQ
ncbi:hypothetical protein LJC74_01160 [Eubacteriales bacterium OttesenSCG-928-A19]|nr:hypothetical protein [Eubacteriales bacterium OttesenSCG-928-A19]